MKAFRHLSTFLAACLLLSGCKTEFHDFTPDRITQNPSGIYTFSFSAELPSDGLIKGSESAKIVINGDTYPMTKISGSDLTFSFDYRIPQGVTEARYYYILNYKFSNNGTPREVTKYSSTEEGKIYQSKLINRYPIQLVADRGPTGSTIALVGSGFTPQDVVLFGETEATTNVLSPNSIEFTVPSIDAGRTYDLVLLTSSGIIPVGPFRIDAASLRIQPDSLAIASGDTDFLIFETDNPAPAGGLYVDVKTDVPTSIIMPEVVIPEGARSVNVNITAGEPGKGIIQASAAGYNTIEIPVSVE